MELWGCMQTMMDDAGVHHLLESFGKKMQEGTMRFAAELTEGLKKELNQFG